MENTAVLQAVLILATACLLAYCLTLHNVSKFRILTAFALMCSTFVSFVCVRWIPFAVQGALSLNFFLLAIAGASFAYFNFFSPETDRIKTGSKLAFGLGAVLLLVIIFWTFDNYKFQKAERAIEHVSGKVDTLAATATTNAERIGKIDTTVANLAKSDTATAKTIADTKSELWDKIDETGQKTSEKLSDLSLQQQRMNTNQQKKK